MSLGEVRISELQRAGFRRATKVFINKSQGQPPIYVPNCWVRVKGVRVDIVPEESYDLVQTKVNALSVAFENCIIGWEEPPA